METFVKVIPIQQLYAFPKDIMTLIGRGKTATHYITKEYQEFVRDRPNYFNPLTPLVDNTGETIQYNVICFLHFFENRSQLRSGSRSIVFDHIFEQEKYLVGGNHGIYTS